MSVSFQNEFLITVILKKVYEEGSTHIYLPFQVLQEFPELQIPHNLKQLPHLPNSPCGNGVVGIKHFPVLGVRGH